MEKLVKNVIDLKLYWKNEMDDEVKWFEVEHNHKNVINLESQDGMELTSYADVHDTTAAQQNKSKPLTIPLQNKNKTNIAIKKQSDHPNDVKQLKTF